MANRPTRIGTQTSDVNGTTPTLSLSNLEEYFKILETEVSKLTKAQKDSLVAIKKLEQKSNDDLEKARFEARQQHIKDLAKMEGELALDNPDLPIAYVFSGAEGDVQFLAVISVYEVSELPYLLYMLPCCRADRS